MSDTEREPVSALTEPVLLGELGMRRVIFVVIAALMFATASCITHSPVEGLLFATSKKACYIHRSHKCGGPMCPCELQDRLSAASFVRADELWPVPAVAGEPRDLAR